MLRRGLYSRSNKRLSEGLGEGLSKGLSHRYSLCLRLALGVRYKGQDTIRSPSICGIVTTRSIGSITSGSFSSVIGGGFNERLRLIGTSYVSNGLFPALGREIRTVTGASEQSERV